MPEHATHPEDKLLRKMGYRLVSRPLRGEPTWILPCGITHTHSEALERLKQWQEKQEREGR